MIMALAASAVVILLAHFSPWGEVVQRQVRNWLHTVQFSRIFLRVVLGFFLFAGAFRINLDTMFENWVPIALLAIFGTAVSMAIVGGLTKVVSTHGAGAAVDLLPALRRPDLAHRPNRGVAYLQ
jgi:NhaP-type Na+/H+ or K+/H+ antiporter